MSGVANGAGFQPSSEAPSEDRLVLQWLESQPGDVQSNLTKERLEVYLADAAQPRQVSGNACIKLCYFIEQCMKSKSPSVRDSIFSEKPCLDLFDFYIEWNEKNQNRSMRQVMELISTMIIKNPSSETAHSIKKSILERDISIITHQAAQPLVKPAFKSLESLMSKGTINAKDLLDAYPSTALLAQEVIAEQKNIVESGSRAASQEISAWDGFFSAMFDWMKFPDISPAAGKFLVTVFQDLRTTSRNLKEEPSNTASWQRWIRKGLGKYPEALENVKNYLFTPLFKFDKVGSLAFLEDLNGQNHDRGMNDQEIGAHSLLQLSAMETGKKAGLVVEPDIIEFQMARKKSSNIVVLKEESIGALLTHESDTVRSLAFSVLVSSLSTVRPFSDAALVILQSNMYILYSDTDAKFRNEIMSSTKHMIERLRGATSVLVRELRNLSFKSKGSHDWPEIQKQKEKQRQDAIKDTLCRHEEFISWYIEFLLLELIPTASYQRHITSLKAILLLLRSGILNKAPPPAKASGNNTVWPCSIDFFTRGSLRLLMDLLLDPFEDVRSGATNILKLTSPHSFQQVFSEKQLKPTIGLEAADRDVASTANGEPQAPSLFRLLDEFIARAEELSKQTGRADHADGVARSYELYYGLQTSSKGRLDVLYKLVQDLEGKVEIAERSLGQAVFDAPIHGTFAALTFVWDSVDHSKDFLDPVDLSNSEQLGKLQQRMANCCSRIWDAVKSILCNDSPEGYLPQDLDGVNDVDTKDVLSYSFRAVHESSNLMRVLVNKIKLRLPSSEMQPLLSADLFHQIGELSFQQLSTLRHRGAFSTVTLTFATCCQVAVHPSLPPSTSMLLVEWYQGALDCVTTQVSTTRRSAGIPALVTGILSAQAKSPSLSEVLEELLAMASAPVENLESDDTQLPQVHALNCIKDMVRNPTIRLQVEKYVARLFLLALESLRSKKYPIQNCGLILFRSLADSIFGTSPSKLDIEDGWDGKSIKISYDRYPSLPETIVSLLRIGTGDTVLPALDFLRRAGPPTTMKDEIEDLVSGFLGHKAWQIRETAAHTLCSLTMSKSLVETVRRLSAEITQGTNDRHGKLLAIKVILGRRLPMAGTQSPLELSQILPVLVEQSKSDVEYYASTTIVASHLEIFNSALAFVLGVPTQNVLSAQLKQEIRQLHLLDWTLQVEKATSSADLYSSLSTAVSKRYIYALALENNIQSLPDALELASTFGSDALIGALRCISDAWKSSNLEGLLKYLSAVYCKAIKNTSSLEVQKAALEGLCELLDSRMKAPYTDEMETIKSVLSLEPRAGISTSSPAIWNLWTSLSGWLTFFEIVQRKTTTAETYSQILNRSTTLQSWSRVWMSLGKDSQDFDTRIAAAYAISTFYTHLIHYSDSGGAKIPAASNLLPSKFALYNILNDDDSDIRSLGAKAVSVMLRKSMIPQAATKALAEHMLNQNAAGFPSYAVARMTGTLVDQLDNGLLIFKLEPASTQLERASQGDNKLFTEEKQNLWIDEVQDATIWCEIFQTLPLKSFGDNGTDAFSHNLIQALLVWVTESVKLLNKIARKDGAIGWTSKPEVFAVVLCTIKCINSFLEYTEKNILASTSRDGIRNPCKNFGNTIDSETILKIMEGLESFANAAVENDIHPVLVQTLLERDFLDPSFKRVHGQNYSLIRNLTLSQDISSLSIFDSGSCSSRV
ncbi:HEAT repeat protein [Diplocarpon rosae]|nr:HEAT repeat protein [Diplocarpon rosae]